MKTIEKSFLLKPIEPLYFGGPSSFGAGEQHVGQSEFPPTPFAFQGLVRSHILRFVEKPALDLNDWSVKARNERKELVGEPDSLPEGWQIQGPYPTFMKKEKNEFNMDDFFAAPWVPAPRFLLDHDPNPLHARPMITPHLGINDLCTGPIKKNLLLLGRPEKNALSPIKGWIGPENLLFALAGEGMQTWRPEKHNEELPPFIKNEFQPGVAIDPDTSTAIPGKLYTLKTLRFDKNAGLAGWFKGSIDKRVPFDLFETGVVGAGRKGRIALFEKTENFHPDWAKVISGKHLPDTVDENDSFWLLTITPVRLQYPAEPDLKNYLPPDITIVIRGALTGSPAIIGGYQMATGHSRFNRKYLPAGSAWLFQLRGGDPQQRARFLLKLNNAHLLGPSEEAKFGFGHTFVGIGPQIKEIES
jgi:CRISPR-associated protein (Cas_Cmr3)